MDPSRLPVLVAVALLAGCLAPSAPPADGPAASAPLPGPHVVVAAVDTGINPYHRAFRDAGPSAYAHPSTYLAGYPPDAPALRLSLNETSLEAALAKDAAAWDGVEPGRLYWIPGTRIVGAITLGPGGARCGGEGAAGAVEAACPERPILDDHGHGTMAASRMAAAGRSLAPAARIVAVEGPGPEAVRWVAAQGWIDVQASSWAAFAASGAGEAAHAFADAAARMVVVAGSGNDSPAALASGAVPTHALAGAAPGVVLVGAHDNGRLSAWSGAPPHVVADGYGGWTALHDSLDAMRPDAVACCTSAAASYAAGGAAAIVLEARAILGDPLVGPRSGVLAEGAAGTVGAGPLADGNLTLDELRRLLLRTASARPAEGPHDGLVRSASANLSDPAADPRCLACRTLPVQHRAVPAEAPLFAHAGYGAVDPASVALARDVLLGLAGAPDRQYEDAFFALDAAARERLAGPVPPAAA